MNVDKMIDAMMAEIKQKLSEFCEIYETQELSPELAEALSAKMKEALSAAGIAGYRAVIQSYDTHREMVTAGKRQLRWKCVSEKEFLTPFGKMRLKRNLYQGDRGGQSYAPVDAAWGMEGEFATPEVREAVLYAVASMPPEEVVTLLGKCALFQPSGTAVKNIVEEIGAGMEERGAGVLPHLREQETVPAGTIVLVSSLDGVNVPLREEGCKRGRPAERPRKSEEKQCTAWKNAMVGSVSFYGGQMTKEKVYQRLESRYLARMPEERAVRLKGEFERELSHWEALLGSAVKRLLIMDGHRALWKYVESNERYDQYEKLVDFFHTMEHLSLAAEALFGKSTVAAQEWYSRYRQRLLEDADAANSILRSIDYYRRTLRLGKTRKEELEKQRTFFLRNKIYMQYALFRERGWPIGSGVVEAACKTIVKARLCRSGMRWSCTGGEAVLQLRTYVKSNRWDAFWAQHKKLRQAA